MLALVVKVTSMLLKMYLLVVQGVISEVPEIVLRCISRDEAALAVAQKVYSFIVEYYCGFLVFLIFFEGL